MLELRDIHKNFGKVRALNGVSLTIASGSIHGLVGENGAGKTTLMQILTGFIAKSRGQVCIDGKEVPLKTPQDAAMQGIGMLYQEPLDFPQLSVLDNFTTGAKLPGGRQAVADLAALCSRFGFSLQPGQSVEKLTVGERQQLELLRLIRGGVRILILDEPTTGISEKQQQLLFHSLLELKKEGASIILVSHKLDEVDQLCDEVTVLRQGKVTGHQNKPFDREILLQEMFNVIPSKEPYALRKSTEKPVLEFSDVSSSSGRSGLDNISVRVCGGEIIGLAGLDGSGQYVFLKIGAGLLDPEEGTVRHQGENSTFLPADRLAEGLISGLSIREHHLLTHKGRFFIPAGSGRSEAAGAIDHFSIVGTPDTPADSLSGGNQQRLLLSLIPDSAKLLFIENPTRGLDVRSAAWTWQQLRSRLHNDGAICFASPDLEEILDNASRILVFFNGRILLDLPREKADYKTISRAITGQC